MMIAFLLTALAASTTILGGLFALAFKKENTKALTLSLSFSAGVMIYLSFMEILPKGFAALKEQGVNSIVGVFTFFLGVGIIVLIDHLSPRLSHHHEDNGSIHVEKLGLMSMVLITLHNFPEGMAVFSVASENASLSWPLVLAIAIHNLPEGLVIAAPIYFSTGNKKKAMVYATLSALAEPVGGLIGYTALAAIFSSLTLGIVFCFVAGIMVFLSIDQILPEARKVGDHHLVGYGTLVGMLFMALSLWALS